MSKQTRKRRAAKEPRTLPLPPPGYQPSKAELEEEIDMPGPSPTRKLGSDSSDRSGSYGTLSRANDERGPPARRLECAP